MMRVAILGAGHVGATTAFALMLRGLVSEIVLVDPDHALAVSEARDLSDANALARPSNIWAGNYADAARADIVIATAGAATHGDESRLSVAGRSAEIVRNCVTQLAEAKFGGILLVAANPVDLMSLVAYRYAGLPSSRVIGTGTLLDSMRLRQLLSDRLSVAARSIDGFVLGEHGDSEVAALSTVRVGGVPLAQLPGAKFDELVDVAARHVRQAGYEIIAGKGYTSFGIATAVVRICEAIIRDENDVLPLSTLLTGQFDIADMYLSLPCVLGSHGVVRVLTPDLTDEEAAGVFHSASVLRAAMASLDAGHREWQPS